MNTYKKRMPFISLVCVLSLLLSMLCIPVAAADTNSVTATTNATVTQGSSGSASVYIDSTENIAALDVTIHFDPAKVKITGVYNSVSCTLYDSVTNSDNIQFSYIFDGKGSASKTRLFYFYYQVLSTAEVGDAWFDITIGEAFDSGLNEIAVSGSRCAFTVKEKVTSKTCSVYSTSSVSTAVQEEFSLNYRFSTYQIASGTAVITYDPELFEVVAVKSGTFLNDKIVDINTDLTGEIDISFVSTKYNYNTDFITVTFKTIKNTSESSKIVLKTTELCDLALNPISCSGYTTTASIVFDETYVGDAPTMQLDGTFSYEDMQITLVVSLEENSHLGAGDFVISFDPDLVSYNSCNKEFNPTFFNINDKGAEDGILKFHIISLSDIVTEEKVLTVVFDVKHPYGCETADFTLDGTGLTDSLTESILLNFMDDSVWLEYQVTFCDFDGTVLQSGMYHYGDPVLPPDTPTKEPDKHYIYCFTGWDQEITPCTQDAVYTAVYTKSLIIHSDDNKDAVCDICADQGCLVQWNISLQNDFRVNFYVDAATESDIIYVSLDGNEIAYPVRTLSKNQDGYYCVSLHAAAAQMTAKISLSLVSSDQTILSRDYTIRQYCDIILSNSEHSQYHALVGEMLHYGAMAQIYFDYDTENLANDGITNVAAADVPETTEDLSVSGKISDVSFYGASLVYRDRIAVRYYFTGDFTGCTFTANGNTYTPVAKDGMYYIEIADILPQDLDQQITLTVTDAGGNTLTVTYGPMNYIVRMNEKGSDALKALVKALYNYHLAAKALSA